MTTNQEAARMGEKQEFVRVDRLDRARDLLLTASVSADQQTVRLWDGNDSVRYRFEQAKLLHEWLGTALARNQEGKVQDEYCGCEWPRPETSRYSLDKDRCGLVEDATGNWVQITDHWTVCIERDSLATEAAALRADARRYRWLRAGDNDELVLRIFSAADNEPSRLFDARFDNCYLPRDEKLDAAIDAASQQKDI